MREQLESIRGWYEADRAAGVTGVWLPDGLERKYPKAGGVRFKLMVKSLSSREERKGRELERGAFDPSELPVAKKPDRNRKG